MITHRRDFQISMMLNSAYHDVAVGDVSHPIAGGRGTERTSPDLQSLIDCVHVLKVENSRNSGVSSLVWDSRQVTKSSLFFAIKGESFDGNSFVSEAVRKGACAIVTDQKTKVWEHVPVIYVDDCRVALAKMAKVFYGKPDSLINLVGVTGTNGKTSVSRMIKYLLDGGKDLCGLIGTIEYVVGKRTLPSQKTTPEVDEVCALLAEMKNSACDSAVMEVSSHGLDQNRVYGISFNTAVFLNLTQDHLDYHGNMEAYFEAKKKLFVGNPDQEPANKIINLDDAYGRRLVDELKVEGKKVITFGTREEADYRAQRIEYGPKASKFVLNCPEGEFNITLPIPGSYNILNALAAIAAVNVSGISAAKAAEAISTVPQIPGRLEIIDEGQAFEVVVDYAHTPDALEKAIRSIKDMTNGNVSVVFGCGGDRDRAKRPQMMKAACDLADVVYATSDNPRKEEQARIFDDMLQGMDGKTTVRFIEDREEAIRRALIEAKDGDLVLIAGKGHEAFQEFKDTIVPFDDRQISRAILRENQA